eukprot:s1907_g14.t1
MWAYDMDLITFYELPETDFFSVSQSMALLACEASGAVETYPSVNRYIHGRRVQVWQGSLGSPNLQSQQQELLLWIRSPAARLAADVVQDPEAAQQVMADLRSAFNVVVLLSMSMAFLKLCLNMMRSLHRALRLGNPKAPLQDSKAHEYVPEFSNKSSDYKEFKKRVQLYEKKMTLAGRSSETAFNVMAALTGRAWDAVEDLQLADLETAEGISMLLKRLDTVLKYDALMELPNDFENFFMHTRRGRNQNIQEYAADFERALSKESTYYEDDYSLSYEYEPEYEDAWDESYVVNEDGHFCDEDEDDGETDTVFAAEMKCSRLC